MIQISKQLKHLLKERDIKVAQLSRACGVSQKTISDWLISNRSPRNLEHLKKVADYFEVSVDYILFGTSEKLPTIDPFKVINEYTSIGTFEVVLRKVK